MLTLLATDDVAHLRGRWLRLHYSQSFRGQPVRPLLRFASSDGSVEEHVLPAAAFGRARWIGWAPETLVRLDLSAALPDAREFRLDALHPGRSAPLLWQGIRRHPSGLVDLALWLRKDCRERRLSLQRLLDLEPLDRIATFATERTRVLEPDGLDAGLLGRDDDSLVAFAVAAGGAESVRAAIDALLASPARFVGLLRPSDRLRPEALPILRDALTREPGLRLLYADSAVADAAGRLTLPELKPDWSPDFLAHADYVGRPSLVRTDVLRAIAGAIALHDADPWWRVLRLAGAAGPPDGVLHLRRLLLHRPATDALPSPSRGGAGGGGRGDEPPEVPPVRPPPRSDAARPLGPPHEGERCCKPASIVIPTRNRVELLRRAVDSIGRLTPAASYDLVIVDNGSDAPDALAYLDTLRGTPGTLVLHEPGPFNFSRLANRGVAAARQPVVVLLNNDCEILHPGWLDRLSAMAVRPGTGAVGARLLYPDGTLQHAGIGIGLGGYAGHRDRGEPGDHPGHLGRLRVPHEVSAVTAACLAVARETYLAAGGFDEGFAVAFNDVDFCLRLASRGLRNILAPDVELRHAESASRGRDADGAKRARFLEEAALFAERWRPWIQADPYTHPLFAIDRFSDRLG